MLVLAKKIDIGLCNTFNFNIIFTSNRKGKLITLYDWNITGKLEGETVDGETSNGTIEIKNFSFENEVKNSEVSHGYKTCIRIMFDNMCV